MILNMLRLSKVEKQICPERSRVNTLRDSNILFEHHFSDSKIIFHLSPVVQYIEVAENPILLQTFDLKAKCIISERTLTSK